jgi:hypothetical protein
MTLLTEFNEPVLHKLQLFNLGVVYEIDQINFALREVLKSSKVNGVTLFPDQTRISEVAHDSDQYKLLVNHTCKLFVDRFFEASRAGRKRIQKQQRNFAFDLDGEIYRLENGEAMCSIPNP